MKEKEIINVMEESFIPYASEILLNNLPSVTDGLLPVHRKVLWALNKNKIFPDKPFIKLLRAGAYTMVYYVFGDMPLYKAMKNMANNSLNNLYLDPKGSFGDKRKKDGVGASPRYIECRMSKYGRTLLNNINKNNVEFKMNFDNTEKEPINLPSYIPNVLVNTSQSIAVGEASRIPSHNIIDICDSFISFIDTQDIEKSIKILKCPDFSLGGMIPFDENVFDKIYKTGKGSFSIIGKYRYDEKNNKITIYEIPYETYIEDIESKLEDCIEKGLFKEVTNYHNKSDKDGIALDIYIKKNTNINNFILKLRKNTPFECKFSCNFTLIDLDNKTPQLMSLEDIIRKWLRHRQNCIQKEYDFDINDKTILLHRLQGLQILNSNLDEAIKIIRHSKKELLALERLIKYFNLTQEQAEYISTIRLVNINEDWINDKIINIKNIENEINKLTKERNDIIFINNLIKKQLEKAKVDFGKPRMTDILYNDITNEINKNIVEVEDFTTTLILTDQQYFKKTKKYSENQKLKEDDAITTIIQDSNRNKVMFLSDKGNMYLNNLYELDENTPSSLGQYLPNLLPLDKDETILGMISSNNYNGYVLIIYEDGHAVKIPLSSYKTKTNRSKLSNCLADIKPILITQIIDCAEIELTDSFNKTKIIKTEDIPIKTSRNSRGKTMWYSKKQGFKVVSAQII
ncbi:DNA topoisomerase (ATP-hydrolyzing) subunit A [Clostridium sp. VAP52]|uniref:DNA topoisomerase (ATP-hydrolyzing) subunit A n=1 Tax=Clostridium sp. VAP52 TaxID=2949977 RepID=UPI00207AE946|nr:DNA topoisomerase (ATP-hydrolyzing) subunit A [Clostridium sp. VAP52]